MYLNSKKMNSVALAMLFSCSTLAQAQTNQTTPQPAAITTNTVNTVNQAQQQQSGGGGSGQGYGQAIMQTSMSVAMANMMMSEKFSEKCPISGIFCMMAAMSAMQVGMMALTGGSGKKTKQGFQASGGTGFDHSELTAGADGSLGEFNDLKIQSDNKLKELAAKGFKVDPKAGTVTGPGGKKASFASLASGKAALDAGLANPEEAAAYDKALKEAKDKFKVVAMEIGGGGSAPAAANKPYKYEDPYASLYGEKEKPDDPKTKGLTRMLASGESIGTQTDNIFEMVHRKYQDKNQEDEYFVKANPDNK